MAGGHQSPNKQRVENRHKTQSLCFNVDIPLQMLYNVLSSRPFQSFEKLTEWLKNSPSSRLLLTTLSWGGGCGIYTRLPGKALPFFPSAVGGGVDLNSRCLFCVCVLVMDVVCPITQMLTLPFSCRLHFLFHIEPEECKFVGRRWGGCPCNNKAAR